VQTSTARFSSLPILPFSNSLQHYTGPSLASLVLDLDLSPIRAYTTTAEHFQQLFRWLPFLRSLNPPVLDSLSLSDAFDLSAISTRHLLFLSPRINIRNSLEVLREFDSLERLEVDIEYLDAEGLTAYSTTLDNVQGLSFMNRYITALKPASSYVNLARFVDSFPRLTSLSLFATFLPQYDLVFVNAQRDTSFRRCSRFKETVYDILTTLPATIFSLDFATSNTPISETTQ